MPSSAHYFEHVNYVNDSYCNTDIIQPKVSGLYIFLKKRFLGYDLISVIVINQKGLSIKLCTPFDDLTIGEAINILSATHCINSDAFLNRFTMPAVKVATDYALCLRIVYPLFFLVDI
jgi:hypothetical protein